MTFARIFWPLGVMAALAACSGNLGGGQSTLPGTPQSGTYGGANVQQVAPAATATPVSASNVATIGENVAPQALPDIMGWGGTIAFSKPAAGPSASPNPKATATPSAVATVTSVSVGITASVVNPSEAPRFGSASAKRGKRDPGAVMPLFFISLLSTSDVTLGAYPKIAINVPREIAAKHTDDVFALALYDPADKEKAYKLEVAERDLSSPLPGSMPSAPPTPIPTPFPTPQFGQQNGPAALTPPPIGTELGGSSLPPEYVAFAATTTTFALKSNRPVVFALYAVAPSPSPSPSGPTASKGSALPGASPGSASTAPPSAASPQPSAAPSTTPAAKPSAS